MKRVAAAAALSVRTAADEIRARDPGFELEVFLQRAEMIFFLVKRGIQQNDAAALRPYVDDRVFAAVSAGIGQAKSAHQHALLESLNVRAVHVDSAACDDSGQRIVIHFDLVYRAQMRNDSNQVIADEGGDQRHGERWTALQDAWCRQNLDAGRAFLSPGAYFTWRAQLESMTADGRRNVMENVSVQRIDPVQIVHGRVFDCRAAVTSGKFDWVVLRIEQGDAGRRENEGPGGLGRDVALQVGGAIVGGLLASLLSDRGSDNSRDWN